MSSTTLPGVRRLRRLPAAHAGVQPDFIPCYTTVINGDYEMFLHEAKKQRFLLTDDAGAWRGCRHQELRLQNVFHRTCWAKLVLDGFKETSTQSWGRMKSVASATKKDGRMLLPPIWWRRNTTRSSMSLVDGLARLFPRLIETVYRCVIVEELYDYQKKNLKGSINFKTLKHFVVEQIKNTRKDCSDGSTAFQE